MTREAPTGEGIRVVVSDDHPVVREGLRSYLESQGFDVVGEAADGNEAIRVVRDLRPDVLLTDLVMPGVDGIETIRRLRAEGQPLGILVLTSFSGADQVIPAGAVLQGTTRMAALYKRWCAHGRRADLARQLVGSRVDAALVRTGPLEVVRPTAGTGGPAPAPAPGPREHRVARGDTLAGIARRYGCETRELAQANRLKAPSYAIRIGQRLRLEGCSG